MVVLVIVIMVLFQSSTVSEISLVTSDLIESPVVTSFLDPFTILYALIMEILGVIFEFATIAFIN